MIFEKQIEQMYKAQLFTRCDDTGNVFYFSSDDFEGLTKKAYSFQSSKGHPLQGYFYQYPNANTNHIIVFDHGHGGGHRSYMVEIEHLCKAGYLVFSYDHTGCMESGGESTHGFAQSLVDLNDCLNNLKQDYPQCTFSVMGHSWGAYSCLNIAKYHNDLTHIIAISGFVSVKQMIDQNFSGILKGYRNHIYQIEQDINHEFATCNASDTLKNTTAKVLLIYSEDDMMVKKELHYDVLKNNLSNLQNIEFLLVKEKGHNPNYTTDAVRYKDAFLATLQKKTKKKQLQTKQQKEEFKNSFDWHRMTKQDPQVWQVILNHLKK